MTQFVLSYPDWNKHFILTTNASNETIGAILSQGTIGKDKPLAFASRTLNKKEIISDAHSGILGGHYSVEKTTSKNYTKIQLAKYNR